MCLCVYVVYIIVYVILWCTHFISFKKESKGFESACCAMVHLLFLTQVFAHVEGDNLDLSEIITCILNVILYSNRCLVGTVEITHLKRCLCVCTSVVPQRLRTVSHVFEVLKFVHVGRM